VAIFFLAGHETSASALAWALYLLAMFPDWQDKVAAEALREIDPDQPEFAVVKRLAVARDVFRETLRLYPPVPMMVRETTRAETFRGRALRPGTQVVISPWHLHRSERHWPDPDAFRPDRWQREASGEAYLPFSAGRRVCPGAGFAMAEAVVILAHVLARVRLSPAEGRRPEPVAFLTVRSRDGIRLRLDAV
jgi:cytochrome P450